MFKSSQLYPLALNRDKVTYNSNREVKMMTLRNLKQKWSLLLEPLQIEEGLQLLL